MSRSKPFLRGLGIGVIAGAILLQLLLQVSGEKEQTTEPVLPSGSPMASEAPAATSTPIPSPSGKLFTQSELDEAVRKARAEEAAKKPAVDESNRQITVYIYDGMSAAQVVEYFYKSGIIVDRMAFQDALSKGALTSKLQAGLYTFKLNDDMNQVITQITTKHNT